MLDTHTLLWWHAGGNRLSPTASSAIASAAALIVSAVTAWEIAMLVSKGRVALGRPTSRWIADLVATEDRVTIVDVTPALAVAAGELTDFHGDPADRLIVATALAARAPLITKDRAIARDGATVAGLRTLW